MAKDRKISLKEYRKRFVSDGLFSVPPPKDAPAGDFPKEWRENSLALRGQLACPKKGWFRVIGVDTFEGPFADFLVGDFEDRAEAIAEARSRAGQMKPVYVYNDSGELIFSAGSPS